MSVIESGDRRLNVMKRPLRMKGYHRAKNRGETWAVLFFAKSPLQRLFEFVYHNTICDVVLKDNPLYSLIKGIDGNKYSNLYHQPVILKFDNIKKRKRSQHRGKTT